MNMAVSIMPGTTPARKRRPIDVCVEIPYTIIVTEGGIRIPSVPPAAMEPVATEFGYPRLTISGMPILPMAAHVAGLDPVIPEKIAQAPILDNTNPPGTLYSQRSKA